MCHTSVQRMDQPTNIIHTQGSDHVFSIWIGSKQKGDVMKRLIVLCTVAICVGCNSGATTLDCSSDEAYSRSYEAMLEELSPEEQAAFMIALVKVNMKALADANPSNPNAADIDVATERLNQTVDGKTAADIIDLAETIEIE